MTSHRQITAWAAAGESETQEFKRSTGQRREAARAVCAMLNHRGGRVLFGVEPGGRVSGQQVSDHTVDEVAEGLREIEPAERFLLEHMPIAGRFDPGSMVRIDEPAYAPLAFREAVANAICHREYTSGGSSVGVAIYDDRLEVTSSGTLHFGFTPQALFEPHESRPWNPLIASVFHRRGIIETWGQGTLKMAAWAEELRLPRPEILEIPGAVVVRFRRMPPQGTTGKTTGTTPQETPQKTLQKTPQSTSDAILELLRQQPELTFAQIATLLRKSDSAVKRAVRKLRESGRVQRIGPDKGGHWKVIE
ncbi:MAG: putative DNA binding domain-containing protein [Planctomycetes bacterium]|nr:putative DNA binding domain-containing protein [Planctomycetota bacterium]